MFMKPMLSDSWSTSNIIWNGIDSGIQRLIIARETTYNIIGGGYVQRDRLNDRQMTDFYLIRCDP